MDNFESWVSLETSAFVRLHARVWELEDVPLISRWSALWAIYCTSLWTIWKSEDSA